MNDTLMFHFLPCIQCWSASVAQLISGRAKSKHCRGEDEAACSPEAQTGNHGNGQRNQGTSQGCEVRQAHHEKQSDETGEAKGPSL
ncbi:hypothetical protein [Pedococcus sp. 5OH_020]|uniref:hypothetical protein n=1 Tax=Pedococcus sp. 5OH_020 TaxID=2989814 RepID=UPI0022E9D106|nr:hypothetical protein [Pedococcus sp. 5OH_020]